MNETQRVRDAMVQELMVGAGIPHYTAEHIVAVFMSQYEVINMKTGVKYRISGVGFELPHEPLRNLPLGGVWWGKNNRYERIM